LSFRVYTKTALTKSLFGLNPAQAVAHSQGRIKSKLGLMLMPRKGLFSSRRSRQTNTKIFLVYSVGIFMNGPNAAASVAPTLIRHCPQWHPKWPKD